MSAHPPRDSPAAIRQTAKPSHRTLLCLTDGPRTPGWCAPGGDRETPARGIHPRRPRRVGPSSQFSSVLPILSATQQTPTPRTGRRALGRWSPRVGGRAGTDSNVTWSGAASSPLPVGSCSVHPHGSGGTRLTVLQPRSVCIAHCRCTPRIPLGPRNPHSSPADHVTLFEAHRPPVANSPSDTLNEDLGARCTQDDRNPGPWNQGSPLRDVFTDSDGRHRDIGVASLSAGVRGNPRRKGVSPGCSLSSHWR